MTDTPELREEKKPVWKRVSTYVLLGIPATFVFLANTKPEEARTNLAGWAKLAGFERVPEWLASNSADLIVSIAGSTVAAIAVALTVIADRKSRKAANHAREKLAKSIKRLQDVLESQPHPAAVQPRKQAEAPGRNVARNPRAGA